MPNAIVKSLQRRFGKTMPFSKLSLEAKLAMIWYMAIDGEAWTTPDVEGDFKYTAAIGSPSGNKAYQKFIAKNMDWFDKKYGHLVFGLAMVPREEFEKSLLANFRKNPDMNHLHSMESFIKEYREGGPTVNHKNFSWPVIFSNYPEELIQDGWHRMHCYLNKQIATIPCIYYLEKVKYWKP